MPNIVLEYIRTIANCLSAAGIVVAAMAFLLQWANAQVQQQRARREKAIEAIRHYANTATMSWAAARKLVERFNNDQLERMEEGREFAIDKTNLELLEAALPDEKFDEELSEITLNREQSYKLRHEVLRYLNAIEVVFQAWLLDVADADAVTREMSHVCNPFSEPPVSVLRNYREMILAKQKDRSDDSFPAISCFMDKGKPDRLTLRGAVSGFFKEWSL